MMQTETTLLRQFAGFAGMGVIGTTGHYATLIGLVQLAGLIPLLATTAGFIVGASINYILNYKFIFRSNKRHAEALSKFLVVATAGLGLNTMTVWFGIDVERWNYLVAQLAATGVVLVWNFSVNKAWTFSQCR
jgi:putative flippase GtrA